VSVKGRTNTSAHGKANWGGAGQVSPASKGTTTPYFTSRSNQFFPGLISILLKGVSSHRLYRTGTRTPEADAFFFFSSSCAGVKGFVKNELFGSRPSAFATRARAHCSVARN